MACRFQLLKFHLITDQNQEDMSQYRTNASSCMVYWQFVYLSVIVVTEMVVMYNYETHIGLIRRYHGGASGSKAGDRATMKFPY